jgi:hypothetical protein
MFQIKILELCKGTIGILKKMKILYQQFLWNGKLKKDGSQKYKNTEQYSFTNYQDKEVALKAFNQTIALYSEAKKYPFDFQYRVEKDIFNTYWFLTALIQDLEKKEFYLFEKSEYYNPEKPSKKQLKYFLQFLRLEYKIKASHDEKQLIDNL